MVCEVLLFVRLCDYCVVTFVRFLFVLLCGSVVRVVRCEVCFIRPCRLLCGLLGFVDPCALALVGFVVRCALWFVVRCGSLGIVVRYVVWYVRFPVLSVV